MMMMSRKLRHHDADQIGTFSSLNLLELSFWITLVVIPRHCFKLTYPGHLAVINKSLQILMFSYEITTCIRYLDALDRCFSFLLVRVTLFFKVFNLLNYLKFVLLIHYHFDISISFVAKLNLCDLKAFSLIASVKLQTSLST